MILKIKFYLLSLGYVRFFLSKLYNLINKEVKIYRKKIFGYIKKK